MSKVDQLLKQLNQTNVPLVALGELGKFFRGGGFQKPDLQDAGVPAIHYGQLYTTYRRYAKQTISHINDEVALGSKEALPGDLLIAISDVTPNNVGMAVAWVGDTPVKVGGDILVFRHNLNPKYVAYVVESAPFQNQKIPLVTGSTVRHLSAASFSKIHIPVPHRSVQDAIVQILDTFTELESELEAELEARKKQFEHYRNSLLSFPDGAVRSMPLGELLRIRNGRDHKHLGDGEIPVWGTGGIMRYADQSFYQKPSVLIPRKGSLGNLFYTEKPFWTVDTLFYTEIDETLVIPKYVYRFLQTQDLAGMNEAGGVPSLTQTMLNKIQIPVPEITVQRELIYKIDSLDELISGATASLPVEIEARRKQYEYYRDKLLTFKEFAA